MIVGTRVNKTLTTVKNWLDCLAHQLNVGIPTVLCKSNANEIRRISFIVLANFRAKFHAKSFTVKRYFERHFEEILHDILEGQTENRYFENSQKRNFAQQL